MPILDYEPSTGSASRSRWRWLKISLVFTPLAVVVVLAAGAAGHGTYWPFKLLFPYTMEALYFQDHITPAFMLIGLLQFPLYGLLISLLGRHRVWQRAVTSLIVLLHLAAVVSVARFWLG